MTTKITSLNKLERIERKSLLRKSDIEYADYAINYVEGCSHGCKFPCYAMVMSRKSGIRDYNAWIRPKIVGNAMELLNKEIPKLRDKIKSVLLCSMTDTFMFNQPEVLELSPKMIERLNKDNFKSIIITKGILPEILTDTEKFGKNNEYGITLVSLDEKFRQQYEPGAAPLHERIKALRYLHSQGLKTWVSMEPYPTPIIIKQDINEILESVKFVDKIIFGRIHHNAEASKYLKGDGEYYKNCVETVRQFCRKNGIECIIKKKTA